MAEAAHSASGTDDEALAHPRYIFFLVRLVATYIVVVSRAFAFVLIKIP